MPIAIARSGPVRVLLIGLLASCSSSEPTTSPTPNDEGTPFHSGQLSGITNGPVGAAVTTTSAGATVTGLVGRFTSLVFEGESGGGGTPPGRTTVYYDDRRDTEQFSHIWRANLDGSDARQLTFDSLQESPAFDPASHRIAYRERSGGTNTETFTAVRTLDEATGDTATLVTTTCMRDKLEWSPAGNVIYDVGCDASVWETGVGKIFVYPDNHFTVVNSAAGQFALIAKWPLVGANWSGLFKVNYPGRDTTSLLVSDSNNSFSDPAVTRNAPFRLAYWRWTAPDTVWKLNLGLLSDPANTRVIATAPFHTVLEDRVPCLTWTPDGTQLVLRLQLGADSSELRLMDTLGHLGGRLLPQAVRPGCPSFGVSDSGGSSGGGTAAPVTLIGDSGLLGRTASGIIVSQGPGGTLRAVVAFRAAGRRSVRLETGTGLNSTAPTLTYTLRADRLTGLAYTALPADSAIIAVDSASSAQANGALITFNASDGTVALVLPFSTAGLQAGAGSGER